MLIQIQSETHTLRSLIFAFSPLLPDDVFIGNGSLLVIKLPVEEIYRLLAVRPKQTASVIPPTSASQPLAVTVDVSIPMWLIAS